MSIKATFPAGVLAVTVHGLHQWDYGQRLEIHDDTLPALVEVHFACAGMREAVVRSCAVVGGVAQAAIPDICLEQTSPVTAWVYQVDETSGATIKTVVLSVTPRAKPQMAASVPAEVVDKYNEMVASINDIIEHLLSDETVVGRALRADHATAADTAAKAAEADHAIAADTAAKATEADHAAKAAEADHATAAATAETANSANRANAADRADSAYHADYATYADRATNGNITKELIPWMLSVETDIQNLRQAVGISE